MLTDEIRRGVYKLDMKNYDQVFECAATDVMLNGNPVRGVEKIEAFQGRVKITQRPRPEDALRLRFFHQAEVTIEISRSRAFPGDYWTFRGMVEVEVVADDEYVLTTGVPKQPK